MTAVIKAEKMEQEGAEDAHIVGQAAHDIVLYQWPSSQYCDSIYVRCTKVHRLLGYLKASYGVADISFPKGTNESLIADKVKPLMRKIPIIKVDDSNYIEGTAKIVQWLLEKYKCKDFVIEDEAQRNHVWFIEHWAERWLVWLVIYGRWFKENNFVSFVKTFMTINPGNGMPRSIEYIRSRACDILKTTEVGGLRNSEYLQELYQGGAMLNRMLERSEFIAGPTLKECDLSIFMGIQALLDPALEEESRILKNFTALVKWAKRVDELTKTEHTKPIP